MKKKFLAIMSAIVVCMAFVGFNCLSAVSALTVIASVKSATLEKDTLTVGETVPILIEWDYDYGAKNSVSFSSSDQKVAVVDSNGNITAKGTGKAEIIIHNYIYEDKKLEVTVINASYPETSEEYEAFVEQYPDFYRIDEDSVYFSDRTIYAETSLIVSSNNELSVSDNTYGYIFKPEEDGRYVVTVQHSIPCDEGPNDNEVYDIALYPEIFNYVVTVENGNISVSYQGSRSYKQDTLISGIVDVLDGSYFSFVNGYIPGSFDKYITTVYGRYSTQSYFCLNLSWKEENFGRIIISDNKVASEDMSCSTSSAETTDDIMSFIRLKALSDGNVTITADSNTYYPLVVKDGIFHHVKNAPTYPQTFNEYKAFLEAYPDFYRVDEDSVYFVNRYLSSAQMSLIVSSNNELSVSDNTYGYIFKPEEDGTYVVTVEEYREEITETPDEGLGHYHIFYPEIFNYKVVVKNDEITVSYEGTYSWKKSLELNENTAGNGYVYYEEDVLEGAYFTFVNGCIPNKTGNGEYITIVYGKYSTKSYFCVNLRGKNNPERVTISDNNVATIEKSFETASSCSGNFDFTTPDIINFFGIKALADGKVTVTVDGKTSYPLVVKDGIFHYAKESLPSTPGDVNNNGKFDEKDITLLSKWLTATKGVKLDNWKAADMNSDGKLNVFDLCLMKRALIEANKGETKPMLMMVEYSSGLMLDPYVDVSVVDNHGIQYKLHSNSDDALMQSNVKDWCGNGNIDYILKNGEKSVLIKSNDDLSKVANLVESAAKYENTEMENWGVQVDDYGLYRLYALYNDENGELKPLELCTTGSSNQWLNDDDVKSVVKMLIEKGYFGYESIYAYYLENSGIEKPMSNN